jgi:hypothetical protein
MKKSLIALAAALSMVSAYATGPSQVITSSLVNQGSITNTVRTSASVSGIGSSFSGATGAASAESNGIVKGTINPICTGACGTVSGSLAIEGVVNTSNQGTAFNVSTGGGSGTASSTGTSMASLVTDAKYQGPGQTAVLHGDTNATSSVSVDAVKNTGGSATAGNSAEYDGSALVGSSKCTTTTNCGTTTTTTVFGEVRDNKEQTSWAGTGTMTVDGVVLSTTPSTTANASAVTNVTGSFVDPQ